MRRLLAALSLALVLVVGWTIAKPTLAQEPGFAQYFADAVATVWRGNLLIWKDGSTARAVSSDHPFPVDIDDADMVALLNNIDASNAAIEAATEAMQTVLEALAPSTSNTGPISITDAATTELIPLAAGEVIDVHLWIIVGGTNTLTFKYGTGTNCGTGTANLSGAMTFGIAGTNPPGSVVPFTVHVPSGQAFCLTTSSGEDVVGLMSYVQY